MDDQERKRLFDSVWSWTVLLVILSIIDYWCTKYGIENGFFREANPIMNWVIIHMGVEGILISKLGVICFLGICLTLAYKLKPDILCRVKIYVLVASLCQSLVSLYGVVMILWWCNG